MVKSLRIHFFRFASPHSIVRTPQRTGYSLAAPEGVKWFRRVHPAA
jgi:hypothetical protein